MPTLPLGRRAGLPARAREQRLELVVIGTRQAAMHRLGDPGRL